MCAVLARHTGKTRAERFLHRDWHVQFQHKRHQGPEVAWRDKRSPCGKDKEHHENNTGDYYEEQLLRYIRNINGKKWKQFF